MSNLVFPTLPGLTWNMIREPVWSTRVQTMSSGKEQRMTYMSYPLYKWTLNINLLRQYASFGELQSLQGFYNLLSGMFDTFLFADPDDNSFTNQSIGVGDGATTAFQIVRAYGGYIEPVQSPDAGVVIKVNGVTKTIVTDYSINATGVVTFVAAPAAAATITATGTFKYRCRFLQDTMSYTQEFAGVWKVGKLQFQLVKQ